MLPEVSETTKKRIMEIAEELQNKKNHDPKEKKIKKKGTMGESSV